MGFFDAVGGAVAGVGNWVGDVLTGGAMSNAQSVAQANQVNLEQAQKQMDFQERMSNTSYQRGMADMQKAGLNPMLAFSQGGASAPSGSMAQVDPVNSSSSRMAASAISNVIEKQQGVLGIQQAQKGVQLTQNQSDVAAKTVDEKAAYTQESQNRSNNLFQDTENKRISNKILKERHKASAADREVSEMDRDVRKARQGVDVKAAPVRAIMEPISQALGIGTSGKGILRKNSSKTYDVDPGSGEVLRERHYEGN